MTAPETLRARSRAAVATARELARRYDQAMNRNRAVRQTTAARMTAAQSRRSFTRPSTADGTAVRWFRLEGFVDDGPVHAFMRDGTLVCDVALRSRAELLVAVDEVLDPIVAGEAGDQVPEMRADDDGSAVVSTLDGATHAVMLTLTRACDRVTKVEFGIAP